MAVVVEPHFELAHLHLSMRGIYLLYMLAMLLQDQIHKVFLQTQKMLYLFLEKSVHNPGNLGLV